MLYDCVNYLGIRIVDFFLFYSLSLHRKFFINEIENYVHVSKEDIHASEFFFLFLISGIDENYIAINRAYCYISNINFNNSNFIIYLNYIIYYINI